ncbi:MAG: chorismate mutase [Bacteroidales bacterium]|nr:chorismate mutase [Bacteroidales bacterium]
MLKPEECKSLEEVRNEIDSIDKQILHLFGQRYKYVKEVVKYKTADKDSIIAAKRRDAVLQKIRVLAADNNLDPDVFENIYRILIEHFIEEELKIVNLKIK